MMAYDGTSMRLAIVALVALASCASKSAGTGGSSGPEAGVCGDVDAGSSCIYCSDDKWHCGPNVYPPCPASIEGGAACPMDAGVAVCTACPTTPGEQFECRDGMFTLLTSEVQCSPP
jgi:hypothetical protein